MTAGTCKNRPCKRRSRSRGLNPGDNDTSARPLLRVRTKVVQEPLEPCVGQATLTFYRESFGILSGEGEVSATDL